MIEKIGNATLYLGDCLDILPNLEKVNLLLTDPPYGVKMDKGFDGFGGFESSGKPIVRKQYIEEWDSVRPNKEIFDLMLNKSYQAMIFGGNFFADLLPPSKHWIVWDKLNTMPTFGDCELVWTNIDRKSVKKFTHEYNGLLGKEGTRDHPTQKPVLLMEKCIAHIKEVISVLDPFMGSGTTGVACANMGKTFIGIEKEQKYFDIACKRIENAYRQEKLF
jgi:site-specific DNA-methyltransferase (adenine-specific)/modification methylase